MSNLFLTSAIRDIIPTHPEPYPKEILNYANSLYTTSKMSLPLNGPEEIGRYHLCCFVVLEYYQEQYNISDLFINKIPVKGKKLQNLLGNFRNLLNNLILSSTPKSNRIVNYLQTPTSSFSKSTESYIDKVRQSKLKTVDQVKKSLYNTLINVESMQTHEQQQTPPSTPRKTLNSTPTKLSPYKARTKVVITTSILISLCSKFYIPKHITYHILKTYKFYKQIVTNSWGLLIGLVGISYLQLNSNRIKSNYRLKKCLIDNLHHSQHGGLSNQDVKNYIKEVARLISNQKWIKEASYNLDDMILNNGDEENDDSLISLSSFIDSSNEYVSMKDNKHVQNWVRKINSRASRVRPKASKVETL